MVSEINLYITEGNSLSALDSVDPILGTITSTGNNLAGNDASSYRFATSASVQGRWRFYVRNSRGF